MCKNYKHIIYYSIMLTVKSGEEAVNNSFGRDKAFAKIKFPLTSWIHANASMHACT